MHCSPELISAFLDQRCNPEDGERVLIHLANCPECRTQAAFVCQMISAEKEGTLPRLSEEERQKTYAHVNELLKKNEKNNRQTLWNYWITDNNVLSFLKGDSAEPEVLAAGVESSELYFRSNTPRTSQYFWQAALCIEDGMEEKLKISLTDGNGEKILAGDFLLCLIKTKIEDGICFIDREEFAKNLFSKNVKKRAVALRFPDKTIVSGLPVLGTML